MAARDGGVTETPNFLARLSSSSSGPELASLSEAGTHTGTDLTAIV
jgi:hypothetical protein